MLNDTVSPVLGYPPTGFITAGVESQTACVDASAGGNGRTGAISFVTLVTGFIRALLLMVFGHQNHGESHDERQCLIARVRLRVSN